LEVDVDGVFDWMAVSVLATDGNCVMDSLLIGRPGGLGDQVDAGVGDRVGQWTLDLGGGCGRGPVPGARGACGGPEGEVWGWLMLLVLTLLCTEIRLIAGAVTADIDVEPFDPHVLLGQAIAEGGQIVEQHLLGSWVFGFDVSGDRAVLDRHFQPQGAELWRAES